MILTLEQEKLEFEKTNEKVVKYLKEIKSVDEIRFNDIETIQFLAKADNMEGIFQLKNYNARRLLKQIMPYLLKIHEKDKFLYESVVIKLISDINTLIRPSSINSGATDRYLKRLLGEYVESPIEGNYFQQMFEKYTESTQKELLYQEHFMLLLDELLQLNNLGTADNYRRYFEKNDKKKLNELKNIFWNLYKKKTTIEQCKQFWDFIVLCGGYGFNLSHSVSYAIVAYITTYLKVHCTKYFIAVCINDCKTDAKMKKEEKIEAFVHDAEKMGIKVLPPRINHSFAVTTADKNKDIIYLSAHVMVGLGEAISKHLSKRNDFKNIEEFIQWSSAIYSFSKNEAGKQHKTRIFNKGVYEILVRMNYFYNMQKDVKKVAELFNQYFIISEPEWRQKEFQKTKGGKKFNAYTYRLKKDEELLADFEQTCKVIVKEKLLSDNIIIEKSQFWYEYQYLRFTLTDFISKYNRSLRFTELDNSAHVLVESIKHGEKGDYIYTNVKVKWGIEHKENDSTIHIAKRHVNYGLGDILYLNFYDNGKKFYVSNVEKVDSL